MPNPYIRAADLTGDQIEDLALRGSVEVDGVVYKPWRSDVTGPWLQAEAKADPEWPVIFGGAEIVEVETEGDDDAE